MTDHRAQTLLEEWLDAERMARNESAEDAARSCGISTMAFARRGPCEHGIRPATVRALAGYLRTTPEMVKVLWSVPAEYGAKTFKSDRRTGGQRNALGKALYREWLRKGIGIHEAAAEMGIGTTTLQYSVCRNHRTPYLSTLRKVGQYLGVEVGTVVAWHRTPAEDPLPLETWIGRKLHPTVRGQTETGAESACDRCVFLVGCREDVARGDFSWCEEAIPEDVCAGEPESVYESEWEASDV